MWLYLKTKLKNPSSLEMKNSSIKYCLVTAGLPEKSQKYHKVQWQRIRNISGGISVGYRRVTVGLLLGFRSINLWLHLPFTDTLGFLSECGCTLIINHSHVITETCTFGEDDGTHSEVKALVCFFPICYHLLCRIFRNTLVPKVNSCTQTGSCVILKNYYSGAVIVSNVVHG